MGATAAGFSRNTFLATSVLPSRPGSTQPAIWPAGEQRHREVAALALLLGHVRLEQVPVAEHPQRPLPVPDQRVERGQQRRAVRAAAAGAQPGQRRRVGPARHGAGPGRARRLAGAGARHGHRDEPGRRRGLVERGARCARCSPYPFSRWYSTKSAWVATPSARETVPTRWDRHSASVGSLVEQVLRYDPLRQVVDAPPAGAAHADRAAGVEQPLGGDLHLRPVPPRPARLGAAELGRGQRSLVAQPGEHLLAGLLGDLVPALAAGGDRPPPPGVVRPVRDRQDAGRVRPVLERRGFPGRPVRPLDRRPGRPARAGRTRRARATARARRSCRAARR